MCVCVCICICNDSAAPAHAHVHAHTQAYTHMYLAAPTSTRAYTRTRTRAHPPPWRHARTPCGILAYGIDTTSTCPRNVLREMLVVSATRRGSGVAPRACYVTLCVCACTRVCWCRQIFTYLHTYAIAYALDLRTHARDGRRQIRTMQDYRYR